MTKKEIVKALVEVTECDKKSISKMLDGLIALTYEHLRVDGEFKIPGLVKLIKTERRARRGRNPNTGESLNLPAKTVVKLKTTQGLRDSLL